MSRGQVAMEFLAVYGWALLVLLSMISAISYFGLLNPSKLLPSKCTSGTELSCIDYQILEDGTVNLLLKQGVGKTIYVRGLRCEHEAQIDEIDYGDPGQPWSPRDERTETCKPVSFAGLSGEKVRIYYEITYRKSPAGFDHLVAGDLFTTVQ